MMILMVSLREREMIETDEGKGRSHTLLFPSITLSLELDVVICCVM